MHPSPESPGRTSTSFPRRRGDAPPLDQRDRRGGEFPPQARGCTDHVREPPFGAGVSPAGAGMHRAGERVVGHHQRFPRRRGDAPSRPSGGGTTTRFPPQARGCTLHTAKAESTGGVSPAGAGMHRPPFLSPTPGSGFPRRRGDAPQLLRLLCGPRMFPPQARGCTLRGHRPSPRPVVSPAGAGMHRCAAGTTGSSSSFPRRRGDAPSTATLSRPATEFPPQARGCTEERGRERGRAGVSPAGAGMHRRQTKRHPPRCSFPRRRGDAPRRPQGSPRAAPFPPQARGCTDVTEDEPDEETVSPAGAGMHLRARSRRRVSGCFPRRRGDAPYAIRVANLRQ